MVTGHKIRRMELLGSPPATTPSRTVIVIPEKPFGSAISHAPTGPWIVMHRKSPGIWPGIIITAIPAVIGPSGPINHGRSIHITPDITGRISHIYDVRLNIIYINVLNVICRIICRDLLEFIRNRSSNFPGTVW
jgi:hypothetical protein